jgi:hypothetical protein
MKAESGTKWVTELERRLKVESAGERVRVTVGMRSPILHRGAPELEKLLEKIRGAGAWAGWDGEWVVLVFEGTREEAIAKTEMLSEMLSLWRARAAREEAGYGG